MLDPFAGSGTTLVQSLESGHEATGIDLAAFNCLLMRVKTGRYNLFTLEHDLRDALARYERGEGSAGAADGIRRDVVRAAGGRGPAAVPLADRRLRARRRAADRARARGALGAPNIAFRPRLPERPPDRAVLVLQAQARVPPGRARRRTSCGATRSTRSTRLKAFAQVRGPGEARVLHGDSLEVDPGSGFDAVDHLAAVPGADRLPRAASLRLRAARPRRPARAGAGRRGRRLEPGGARPVRRGDRAVSSGARRRRSGPGRRCSSS